MSVAGFENLDIFYHPPQRPFKNQQAEPNKDLYLLDIFTLWTEDATMDPLVFSDALCAVFGLRRPRADDSYRMKEEFKKLASAFKKDWGADWDGNWKFLQPIYGEKPKVLAPIKDILAKNFNSKVYSVLSYGKVNKVEQRVLAIVKEMEDKPKRDEQKKDADAKKDSEAKDKPAQGKEEDKGKKRYFKIMKIYWL